MNWEMINRLTPPKRGRRLRSLGACVGPEAGLSSSTSPRRSSFPYTEIVITHCPVVYSAYLKTLWTVAGNHSFPFLVLISLRLRVIAIPSYE